MLLQLSSSCPDFHFMCKQEYFDFLILRFFIRFLKNCIVKVKFREANVHNKTLNDQAGQVIFKGVNEACILQESQEVNTIVLTLPISLVNENSSR